MLNRINELRASGIAFSLAAVCLVIVSFFSATGSLTMSIIMPQISIFAVSCIGISIAGKGAKHTLSIKKPRLSEILLSALMAILILPASLVLASLVLFLVELLLGNTMLSTALTENNLPPIAMILMVCVAPAIFEEMLFRGVIFKGMVRNMSAKKAIIICGLLFGLFHMDFQRFISQTLLGILCATLVYRSKSIFTGMTVHFVNNFIAIAASLIASSGVENVEAVPESVSMGMMNSLEELAVASGVSTGAAIVVYIIVSAIIIAISLALTYAVLKTFIKRTRCYYEDAAAESGVGFAGSEEETQSYIGGIDPIEADEYFVKKKRRSAWTMFIPGLIVIAGMYVWTAAIILFLS